MKNMTVVVYKLARGYSLTVPAASGTDTLDTGQTSISSGVACAYLNCGADLGSDLEADVVLFTLAENTRCFLDYCQECPAGGNALSHA